ncbi:hypothetical protein [Bifidobacterium biavatii]|nr:hypothetical protein [Bifidobacterium biavatii]
MDEIDLLDTQELLGLLSRLDAPNDVLTRSFVIGVEYGRRLEAEHGSLVAAHAARGGVQ